ncbi:MAG: hypothetical protein CL843_00750 [Crocinitomicaceae bacterium]|nr:hypothetical protein [Crocinitomicaceae bacterium]|tara:strand:+ start:175 stop:591 length:417 start_codon:yes stop_codon:yes gene_type:complete
MLRIKYASKRLNNNLYMGLFFIAVGCVIVGLSFVFKNVELFSLESLGVGQIGAGITLLGIYYFEFKKHYLTLQNGILTKNKLFPKRIDLSKIKSIRYVAGNYVLNSDKGQFVINTHIIAPDSLSMLKNELQQLNVEWR